MIIAESKKKDNIIEYIIYLKQIEDIIRACKLDIDKIESLIISQFKIENEKKSEIKDWYVSIIRQMKDEKVEKKGDIQQITSVVTKVEDLHNLLMNSSDHAKHRDLFSWAKPNIDEYKKLSNAENSSDIQACIDALYGLMLLRIEKKNVADETMQAMQTFSNLLANLAYEYKKINS